MEKVVIAYSGGLDTSVCMRWLREEKGLDVIAFSADVGQGDDLAALKRKALKTGATRAYVCDLKREFAREYVLRALSANAVYEGKYFLATALSRPLIAKKLVEIARKEKAPYVAHGCTGKGNDQVRFEVAVRTLAPELGIIAPVREWDMKSREDEIEYARMHNIPVDVSKKSPYSIDKNLWGVSIECGKLEDPWTEPPEDAFQVTKSPSRSSLGTKYIEVGFSKGVPNSLNGRKKALVELIQQLEKIGGAYGVGRQDLIENRLVGIKSREVYEAPAATILYYAHKELESLVLDRELSHFKEIVSLRYSELIYYGLWFSPLREALDGFIGQTQQKVTGSVRIKLDPGRLQIVGRQSPHSLYRKELATYEKGDRFDHAAAKGFIKIWGMPYEGTGA